MTDGLKLGDLIREEKRRLGSIRRLAEKLAVTDKTVQDWLNAYSGEADHRFRFDGDHYSE